jgi:hypothetical protein
MKSHFILKSFLCAYMLFTFSCKSKKTIVIADYKTFPSILSYEKDPCQKLCAEYNIYVFDNKEIMYEGIRNVDVFGQFVRKLSDSEWTNLHKSVTSSGFLNLEPFYHSDFMDYPIMKIKYNFEDKSHLVSGRYGMPPAFTLVKTKLDSLTKSIDALSWKKVKEYPSRIDNVVKMTEKDIEESYLYHEIIVSLKPTTNADQWIAANSSLGFSVLKVLVKSQNMLLITYSMDKISHKDVLAKLKSDPAVKDASFNRRMTPREH